VPVAIGKVIVTRKAKIRLEILMKIVMPASVVGSVSKRQANLQKKNLC